MIRTPRLLLRRARLSDAEALHPIFSNPQAMRYWSTLPHTDFAQTLKFVENMIHGEVAEEFVVEYEGCVVGKAGIWNEGEIGFILSPEVWGQGFGLEAAEAVTAYYFASYPECTAVTADVDPRNTASLKLLGKLGFQRTGFAERTFRLGEEWCDSVYLALRRP